MAQAIIFLVLGYMAYKLYRSDLVEASVFSDSGPIFKESFDQDMWNYGLGSDQIRTWILQLNQLYLRVSGMPVVVTSWFRTEDEGSKHQTGNAFDARRNSSANYMSLTPITLAQFALIEDRAKALGIPISVHDEGTMNDHFHIG